VRPCRRGAGALTYFHPGARLCLVDHVNADWTVSPMHDADWFDTEQGILDELRHAIFSRDDLDLWMITAAKASFTWRTVDEEIATLTHDSLVHEPSTGDAVDGSTSSTSLSRGEQEARIPMQRGRG
jgi:hypothetical protein